MAAIEEITRAIGAHGLWKQRLREAINARHSDITPDRIRPDNLCDFGKWLYALPPKDQTSAHWIEVRELHAKFHVEAAQILDLAVAGRTEEAEKRLEARSPFLKISAELTAAMMKWKTTCAAG